MVVAPLKNTIKVLLLMTYKIINKKCTHLIVQVIPYIIIAHIISCTIRIRMNVECICTSLTSKCLIHNLVAVVILSNFLGIFNNHFRLKSLLSGNYNTVTCGEIKISYYN